MSVHTEGLGVLVVGGYLGAGKTTLVNHLCDMRMVVVSR